MWMQDFKSRKRRRLEFPRWSQTVPWSVAAAEYALPQMFALNNPRIGEVLLRIRGCILLSNRCLKASISLLQLTMFLKNSRQSNCDRVRFRQRMETVEKHSPLQPPRSGWDITVAGYSCPVANWESASQSV